MPFMSDSTLIRRSAVLRRLNPPNQATHRKWRDVRKFQIFVASFLRDIALSDNRVTFVGIDVNQIALLVVMPIGKGVRGDRNEVIEAESKGEREKT